MNQASPAAARSRVPHVRTLGHGSTQLHAGIREAKALSNTRSKLSTVQPLMLLLVLLLFTLPVTAQDPTPPKGEVIIQSHGDAPSAEPEPSPATPAQTEAKSDATPDITDAERSAVTFTAYDLDARLVPATSHLAMRARVTLHNDSALPLTHIALQISSSLTWESATISGEHLPLAQHLLDTDADHTGKASEAILTLPVALAPGAALTLDTFYSGTIAENSNRLERIGAPHDAAANADWDVINDATALRGFGDVLWYPVSSPQVFLGQGAQLFDAVGQTKLRESSASIRLHLSVEYAGDPPLAAYFCGRRVAFTAISDLADATIATGPGVATADFPAAPLGFRVMSLFLVNAPEILDAPLADAPKMLAVETSDDTVLHNVSANAKDPATLLADWLGPKPLSVLTILDHFGQPFEDGPLLVAPLPALAAADASPALTHSLTHAWVQSGQPWIDEGLAEFFVLLGIERAHGREAATAQLDALVQPVTLIEPALEANKPAPVGQPLTAATSDLYYRRKAAAVWWMLRGIVGDDALKFTLQAWRERPTSTDSPEQQAILFETLLEKNYGKDLQWFFEDWVLHDRGLPDLTLVDVTPRELPVGAAGRASGWLVAVTVRNDGAAVADVPLVIRSGTFSTTQRLRIAGFQTLSTRIVVEAAPTQVLLNDGGTPEQRASTHTRDIVSRSGSN